MTRGRLEAFTDAVIAILITIMVLELRPPAGTALGDLRPLWPVFVSYVLSFAYLAIYWNNHHHLLHASRTVSGRVLWTNMHLLFWLSLVPFATAWIGETAFAPMPMALYGVVLLMAALAYYRLGRALIAAPGQDERLAAAIGRDRKGKVSLLLYLVAILVAPFAPLVAFAIHVLVAAIWIVPDSRIERRLEA